MLEFAYFLLALSWSPEYCASPNGARDKLQCVDRRYGFVTHGLWPQHERGYPRNCRANAQVTQAIVNRMLDIMPSPGLIRHEWTAHGACSGLTPAAYFDLVRKAYQSIQIPAEFREPAQYVTISPADLERKFIASNRGHTAHSIAITCNGRNLREVRLCLTKDLKPRPCGSDVRDQCRVDKAVMRPVR